MSLSNFEFSEELMKKFGYVVHQELEKKYSVKKIFYYIDWRNWKYVEISSWLMDQIRHPSKEILEIIKYNGWQKMSADDMIISILKYVNDHISYETDTDAYGIEEVWQTADDTLRLASGDCEDGAVLIYVLAELSGIPPSNIRIAAGNVSNGIVNVGHCYVLYKPEFEANILNTNWKIIDWTYYYDKRTVQYRPYLNEDTRYRDVWWTVNSKYGYGKYRLR